MNVIRQLRQAYPLVFKELYFLGPTPEAVYADFLSVMNARALASGKPVASGVRGLLDYLTVEVGATTFHQGVSLYTLRDGYHPVAFEGLLSTLQAVNPIFADSPATRDYIIARGMVQTESRIAGSLCERLQVYAGKNYRSVGNVVPRFFKALHLLFCPDIGATVAPADMMPHALRLAELAAHTPPQELRVLLDAWRHGYVPNWAQILAAAEKATSPERVQRALEDVELVKRLPAAESPLRTAVLKRLERSQAAGLPASDTLLLRRILDGFCAYWGVKRPPQNGEAYDALLPLYLKTELATRMPQNVLVVLTSLCGWKAESQNWERTLQTVEDHTSKTLYEFLVLEAIGDAYRGQDFDYKSTWKQQLVPPEDYKVTYTFDDRGTAYPDCTDAQLQAYKEAVRRSTPVDRTVRVHPGINGSVSKTTLALQHGLDLHEQLEARLKEKEKTPMASITTEKKNSTEFSVIKSTAEIVTAATKHGMKVAAADEAANAMLKAGVEILPGLEPLTHTPEGTTLVKYGLATFAIGMIESDLLPIEDTANLQAGATLVIEAAARDGLQPLLAKLTPMFTALIAAGKRSIEEGSK